MKWEGRRGSDNIEDRRGMSGRSMAFGGGGLAIIIAIISFLMGGDPQQLLRDLTGGAPVEQTEGPIQQSPEEEKLRQFVGVVLADNEEIWTKLFSENGMQYRKPTMVLYRGYVESGCGNASSQTGPFYCPADEKIYLDLSFFDELTQRLGAHGDFALAYVISHEVGHHVQNLLGTSEKVREMQSQAGRSGANRLSVALELQADFLAGVWAHYEKGLFNALEDGDIEEAMSAASAVGDDRLQKQSSGRVVPDAFTHGTSEQRMYWFKRGYTSGDLNQGNTFKEVL